MTNYRTEVLAWVDDYPMIERYTETTCDKCGNEADIYLYDDDELCVDCLIDRLISDKLIKPSNQDFCDDCDRDVETYTYVGQSWCADCLVLELQHKKIIKEV